MNKSAKSKTVKAPNYTDEQIQQIIAVSPLDLESCKILADEFGKSYRSVIAKVKSLETEGYDVEYICKPTPKKRVGQVTKAELVKQVTVKLDSDFDLNGLVKAPASAINALITAIDHRLLAD